MYVGNAALSFTQATFSSKFKLAFILPLEKKLGLPKSELLNFRPISNLNTIGNINTTLVVPQHTDCSVEAELQHIANWSCDNKQTINTSKTKEIIFWKFGKSTKHYNIPLIPNIECVDQVQITWGVADFQPVFHPPYWLHPGCDLPEILLNQLRKMSLAISGLSSVFSALIISRILYALPAFYRFLSQRDIDRINAMFRKASRWGITVDEFDMDLLSTISDSDLFKKIGNENQCLHQLLPKVHEVPSYNLRPKPTVYNLPCPKIKKLPNSFICAQINL